MADRTTEGMLLDGDRRTVEWQETAPASSREPTHTLCPRDDLPVLFRQENAEAIRLPDIVRAEHDGLIGEQMWHELYAERRRVN